MATEPRAFLVVHVDDSSRVVDLAEGVEVTFGRSRGATIMIDHEKVSRMHARVKRTGAVIEVEDLGSRNGTRVNGVRIEGPTELGSAISNPPGARRALVRLSSDIGK